MTTQQIRPEVEEHLSHVDPAVHQPNDEPIENLINAYLAGARDEETRELTRRVLADHSEFFDMIGER